MALPSDFNSALATVEQMGILNEDPQTIENRLALSVQHAALSTGQRDMSDLGIGDWTLGVIRRLKLAIHREICDPEKKTIKEDYKSLLDMGLSNQGITAVSVVVTGVVSAINPAFAVSNVVIFLSIWVLKRGLAHLCSDPV
jgi:hypothetical protein